MSRQLHHDWLWRGTRARARSPRARMRLDRRGNTATAAPFRLTFAPHPRERAAHLRRLHPWRIAAVISNGAQDMASSIELEATSREGVGKGAARQARRDGFVPAVVYGGNKDPLPINIRHNILLRELKAGRFLQTLIRLNIDGKPETVICRSVQRDIVRDLPTHADFLRLSERSVIDLAIPIEIGRAHV